MCDYVTKLLTSGDFFFFTSVMQKVRAVPVAKNLTQRVVRCSRQLSLVHVFFYYSAFGDFLTVARVRNSCWQKGQLDQIMHSKLNFAIYIRKITFKSQFLLT